MAEPYLLEHSKRAAKIFHKMEKKDKKQLEAIRNKLLGIIAEPYKFKPLGVPMHGMRRVHIGSFVLTYSIDEATHTVIVEDYAHHDEIYG